MTEHESIYALLALAATDALDPGERARVDRHAAGCEICRGELAAWGLYAHGLAELPQPAMPLGLLERTRARVIAQREAAAERRRESLALAALLVFGWTASWTTWVLLRLFTGGSLYVLGANLVNGMTWSLVSTALAWMTAATAATVLGKRNEAERTI